MVELHQRQQCRRHDGQDRADGRDVIEEEHHDRPEAGEIHADPGHDDVGQRRGRDGERGLDAKINADVAVDLLEHRAQTCLLLALAEHDRQLAPEVDLLDEQEAGIDQHDAGHAHHRRGGGGKRAQRIG